VEQIFTDLAPAQQSSPRVTEIHRPTWSSTRGTVLTAPGYKHLQTPKSNNIGTEQHQIQQEIENNPTMGKPYKKVDMHLPRIDISKQHYLRRLWLPDLWAKQF
jgi:hypothetical protein